MSVAAFGRAGEGMVAMVEFEPTDAAALGAGAGAGAGLSRAERVVAARALFDAAVVMLRDLAVEGRIAVLDAGRADRPDLVERAEALARLEALTVLDALCDADATAEWARLERLAHEAAAAEPAPRVAGSGAAVERALRSVAAEATLVTGLSPRSCQARLGAAAGLAGGLHRVLDAQAHGRITRAQAQAIRVAADELGEVPDPVRAVYENDALALADRPGHTRLRARAARRKERIFHAF